MGGSTFSCQALLLWKQLPVHVWEADSLSTFKVKLKTLIMLQGHHNGAKQYKSCKKNALLNIIWDAVWFLQIACFLLASETAVALIVIFSSSLTDFVPYHTQL